MAELPPIDERAIRARVSDQSFVRGRAYARKGMIFDPRREGDRLRARCRGSSGGPYRVEATLGPTGVAAADCSCPVGDGGYCKHVAALLLTWRDQPAAFRETAGVDANLEQRSTAELVALVKQMLRHQPDLERLLETPLPAGGKRARPPDPSVYRDQAAAAFEHDRAGWGAEAGIADDLSAIVEIGDGFSAQGDHASAAAVYVGVLAETIEHYEEFNGEGELTEPIVDCVAGLGECLAAAEEPAVRGSILRALFDVLRFDFDVGGVGLSDGVPELVGQHATPEERQTYAGWVREAASRSAGDGFTTSWRREAYGGILLDLEADQLDDEAFLRICRETGRVHDLVDRLLELGRTDEAVRATERVGDYELLGLLDVLTAHGRGETAERLALDRLGPERDPRLIEWLKVRYLAEGDRAAALDMAERVFRTRPTLDGYRELRELAGGLGRWEALRPQVLSFLRDQVQIALLLRVHLLEGEIDGALALLDASRSSLYEPGIELEVARAAEATHPRAALAIYRGYAQRYIDQRSRDNYAEASRLLARVRSLHEALGETDEWARYIADLRDRHRTLRALKEELVAAGL